MEAIACHIAGLPVPEDYAPHLKLIHERETLDYSPAGIRWKCTAKTPKGHHRPLTDCIRERCEIDSVHGIPQTLHVNIPSFGLNDKALIDEH